MFFHDFATEFIVSKTILLYQDPEVQHRFLHSHFVSRTVVNSERRYSATREGNGFKSQSLRVFFVRKT